MSRLAITADGTHIEADALIDIQLEHNGQHTGTVQLIATTRALQVAIIDEKSNPPAVRYVTQLESGIPPTRESDICA